MYGMKINVKDLYGSTANVHMKANEEYSRLFDILEDFLIISGDQISDMSAFICARNLSIYLNRLGYINTTNSVEPSARQVTLDLVSGSISPSVDIGTVELPPDIVAPSINIEDLAPAPAPSPVVPETRTPEKVVVGAGVSGNGHRKEEISSDADKFFENVSDMAPVTPIFTNGKNGKKGMQIPGITQMPISTKVVQSPISALSAGSPGWENASNAPATESLAASEPSGWESAK